MQTVTYSAGFEFCSVRGFVTTIGKALIILDEDGIKIMIPICNVIGID